MNSAIHIEQSVLRLIYFKYKPFAIPIGIIMVAIILGFTLVRLQIEDFFVEQGKIKEVKEKITVLQGNIDTLSAINIQKQQEDVQLAITALPVEKDFIGVLYAVGAASTKAGIGLEDYSFTVGKLATSSAQVVEIVNAMPKLEITLNVKGDLSGFERFLTEISQLLPLSSVSKVDFNNDSGSINLSFFYNVFKGQTISFDTPIQTLNAQNNVVLQKLTSYQIPGQQSFIPTQPPTSTASATSSAQ